MTSTPSPSPDSHDPLKKVALEIVNYMNEEEGYLPWLIWKLTQVRAEAIKEGQTMYRDLRDQDYHTGFEAGAASRTKQVIETLWKWNKDEGKSTLQARIESLPLAEGREKEEKA